MRVTTAEEIKDKLHKGVVEFTFIKSDGSIRTAKGTLHEKILNEKLGGKSSTKTSSPKVQVFWDLEKDAFRSFTIGTEKNLISFEEKI
jgi:hypothetical protein